MENENKIKKEENLSNQICEEHNNDDSEIINKDNILNENINNKTLSNENLDCFKNKDNKNKDSYDKNLKNELMANVNFNDEQKEKKIKNEKIDLENNLQLFNKLKRSIIQISSKIESYLNYFYSETNEKSIIYKNSNNFYSFKTNNSYLELIKNYKEKIKNAQEEINIVMSLNNIDLLDNEINKKEKISDNLKFENEFLNKINRKQIKNIYVID